MMGRLSIISKVLGVPVIQKDHNVGHSVLDLYIDYPNRERAYVEVTSDGAQEAWRALDRELQKKGYELKVALARVCGIPDLHGEPIAIVR
jgi:hypothetical protein